MAALRQLPEAYFAEAEDRAQDVVEVVGDSPCQGADRFHLALLQQLLLQLPALVKQLRFDHGDAHQLRHRIEKFDLLLRPLPHPPYLVHHEYMIAVFLEGKGIPQQAGDVHLLVEDLRCAVLADRRMGPVAVAFQMLAGFSDMACRAHEQPQVEGVAGGRQVRHIGIEPLAQTAGAAFFEGDPVDQRAVDPQHLPDDRRAALEDLGGIFFDDDGLGNPVQRPGVSQLGLQLNLGTDALADVMYRNNMSGVAVVAAVAPHHFHRKLLPFQIHPDHFVDLFVVILDILQHQIPGLRRHEADQRTVDDLVMIASHHVGESLVYLHNNPVLVNEHPVEAGVDQHAEALFAFGESFVGVFAFLLHANRHGNDVHQTQVLFGEQGMGLEHHAQGADRPAAPLYRHAGVGLQLEFAHIGITLCIGRMLQIVNDQRRLAPAFDHVVADMPFRRSESLNGARRKPVGQRMEVVSLQAVVNGAGGIEQFCAGDYQAADVVVGIFAELQETFIEPGQPLLPGVLVQWGFHGSIRRQQL